MNEEKRGALRVVLDTNILISSFFWKHGNPHKAFQKAVSGEITCFLSEEIFHEVRGVLSRDFDKQDDVINQLLSFILTYLQPVKPSAVVSIIHEDPDDNVILACALEANADYIVSGDHHLLELKEYEGIQIVSAKEFLDMLEQK